jgi:pilus assembly protein CpaE
MTPLTAAPRGTPIDILHALVVGDPALEDECRAALSRLPDRRVVVYAASTFADALDIARDRQPDFAIVDASHDIRELTAFLKELELVATDVIVAGAFQPHRLGQADSERIIIGLLRAHVRDFLHRPLSPTELREVLDRLFAPSTRSAAGAAGAVAAFIGNKGGVGKSTLAVNVACCLARHHPGRVLLIDASLQLGVCWQLLDVQPSATILDAARQRERLDETLLRGLTLGHESGLRLLAAPADAIEAADVGDEAIARIINLARRTFDYVIVDTFPMLDSVAMAVLDLSDVVFVVFQATAPSITGAMRFLPVLEGMGVPPARQRLVLSRNHKSFMGNLTAPDIEQQLGRRLDHVAPYDRRVLVSTNTGRPYILDARRWSGFRGAIVGMAETVQEVRAGRKQRRGASDRRQDARGAGDRRGGERRQRNVGRAEGDRRMVRDRRAAAVAALVTELMG